MVPGLGDVVEDGGLGRITGGFFDDLFRGGIFQRRTGEEFVGIVHVGPMMLAVMELQGGGADVGCQGVLSVGKVR